MRTLVWVPGVVGMIACGGKALVPAGPAAPAAAAGPAAAGQGEPVYRSVHIDTLAPDKIDRFVAARKAWKAELERLGARDGRGVFVQVGDHTMYTIRAFATFGEMDARGALIDRSLEKVPKAAGEAYDQGADSSLVFPHTSEVWELDPRLSYAPAAGALTEETAAVGRLVLDDVRPDPASRDPYWDAVAAEDQALAEAHYPLTRIGFRTTFGAGHVITLWLAPSQAVLDAAPTVETAVASVRGAARAAELEHAIAGALVRRETDAIVIRHDLTQERAGMRAGDVR